ncbi:hypothetical protein FDECE_7579 [Fusarium decemcellulare]|nr:hypothetical protein FDECE_7579 [Fusarium decemcellulare]
MAVLDPPLPALPFPRLGQKSEVSRSSEPAGPTGISSLKPRPACPALQACPIHFGSVIEKSQQSQTRRGAASPAACVCNSPAECGGVTCSCQAFLEHRVLGLNSGDRCLMGDDAIRRGAHHIPTPLRSKVLSRLCNMFRKGLSACSEICGPESGILHCLAIEKAWLAGQVNGELLCSQEHARERGEQRRHFGHGLVGYCSNKHGQHVGWGSPAKAYASGQLLDGSLRLAWVTQVTVIS